MGIWSLLSTENLVGKNTLLSYMAYKISRFWKSVQGITIHDYCFRFWRLKVYLGQPGLHNETKTQWSKTQGVLMTCLIGVNTFLTNSLKNEGYISVDILRGHSPPRWGSCIGRMWGIWYSYSGSQEWWILVLNWPSLCMQSRNPISSARLVFRMSLAVSNNLTR